MVQFGPEGEGNNYTKIIKTLEELKKAKRLAKRCLILNPTNGFTEKGFREREVEIKEACKKSPLRRQIETTLGIASKFLQSTIIFGVERCFISEEQYETLEETVELVERAYKKATTNPLLSKATEPQLPPAPASTPAAAEIEDEKKEEENKEEEPEELEKPKYRGNKLVLKVKYCGQEEAATYAINLEEAKENGAALEEYLNKTISKTGQTQMLGKHPELVDYLSKDERNRRKRGKKARQREGK